MRTLQVAGSSIAFAAAFAAYGCVLDVSGLEASASNAGGAGPTSASVGPGGGTPSTGVTVTIAASTTGTGCMPTAETCSDGLDNDCDGLTDCADEEDCITPVAGSTCVAPAPGGWTLVSFTPDAAATCPSGFGSAVVVASPSASPGTTCDCNCGQPQSNPCTKGTLKLQIGYTSCGGPTYKPTVTGACDAFSSTVGDDYATGKANALDPVQVTCDATATPPDGQLSGGVTCLPSSPLGGGCTDGGLCLPRSASPSICIQSAGDVECPGGPYQTRVVVAAAANIVDERTCESCSCTSLAASCSGAKLTGYDDAACLEHAVTIDVDGDCHSAANGANFQNNSHFIYSAKPDTMNCERSGELPAMSGGFKLDSPITLCCQ